jgi:hypothetical protein
MQNVNTPIITGTTKNGELMCMIGNLLHKFLDGFPDILVNALADG